MQALHVTPVPVLLVTGPVGVGKTSVAPELSELLDEAGVAQAFVDIDTLRWSYPRPNHDPFRLQLAMQNLAAIWPNFQVVGASRLVLIDLIESWVELSRIRTAVCHSAEAMATLQSLNIGAPRPIAAKSGWTGIDKLPSADRLAVRAPGPKGTGAGGLVGDAICDTESHGGDDQALYAYAREDLDRWQRQLGEPIRSGSFGENLTTLGLDTTGALIGEKWRIGESVLLHVTGPRIPCATFAAWMRQQGWLKTFTRRALPGAYLRVLTPGDIQAGDPISIEFRPDHCVTVGVTFRALTLEPDLLGSLLDASDYLGAETVRRARRRQPFDLFPEVDQSA